MPLPQHITIIPDGDRRWAKGRGVDWTAGYVAGMQALEGIVQHALSLKLPYLSFWILSHDNEQRSPEWQSVFFTLLGQYLRPKCEAMFKQNIGVKIIGDWMDLQVLPTCHSRESGNPEGPHDFLGSRFRENDSGGALIQDIHWIHANSPSNPDMTVVFFLRYTGTRDIQQALQKIIEHGDDPKNIGNYLQTRIAGIPDPDLLIRTSSVHRLSDYMLYQCACTELYFSEKLWPDFTPADFDAALAWYTKTERRFGK